MTEAEWQASADPLKLFTHLRGSPLARMSRWFYGLGSPAPILSERKLKLFLCAWFRTLAGSFPADWAAATTAVADAAEAAVDLPTAWIGLTELIRAEFAGLSAPAGADEARSRWDAAVSGLAMALTAAGPVPERSVLAALYGHRDNPALAAAVRCAFEDPFRRPGFELRWKTETAVELARGVYDERAFDRLPILADALEDAGCDDLRMLAHCRADGPHSRGCWVVDLVLGLG